MSWASKLRWSRMSLRVRLELIMLGTIVLILGGQTVVALSKEITRADEQLAARGTIMAQAVAAASVDLVAKRDRRRFDPLIDRVRRRIDLVALAILARDGRIIAHTDSKRVGKRGRRVTSVGLVRATPGIFSVFQGPATYRVRAPIARGTELLGSVELTFRSDELARRVTSQLTVAVAIGLFWVVVGAVAAAGFVRRITRPLAELTRVARLVTVDRFAEVDLELGQAYDEVGAVRNALTHLVEDVRAARRKNTALVAALEEANVGLQGRVDEVTADLRRARDYVESVLRCMREGVITCDEQARVVRFNDGALRQLRGLGALNVGDDISTVMIGGARLGEAVRRAVDKQTPSVLELSGEPRDDVGVPDDEDSQPHTLGQRSLIFAVHPLSSADGKSLGAVVTVVDVTKRRALDTALRRQDRLVSVGTLAAGLAHELGNYMHSIGSYSSLLLDTAADELPERVHEDITTIRDNNSRAVALLERFLQFARPGQTLIQPADLVDVVREALEICSYRLRRSKIEVADELGSPLEVECDVQLVKQVFVNLVLNAVDAMDENDGERRLRLRGHAVAGRGTPRVAIEVEDSGAGIPTANLERIFDPFFTTKQATGTGLGLSICHQIVTRHGGRLWVSSVQGEGSTFVVELPRQSEGDEGLDWLASSVARGRV